MGTMDVCSLARFEVEGKAQFQRAALKFCSSYKLYLWNAFLTGNLILVSMILLCVATICA